MRLFYYTALNTQGEPCSGQVSAHNESAAIQQLRSQGLYPTQVKSTPVKHKPKSTEYPTSNFSSRVLAVVVVIGFILIGIAALRRQQFIERKSFTPAEGQTLIIDGKKYTVIILPQEE